MQEFGHLLNNEAPFWLIAGPCVIESEQLTLDIAGELKQITDSLGIPFVFKASFDKANRSSCNSFRGVGLEKGLAVFSKIKAMFDIPIITDVHDIGMIAEVASVVDILQTPAFLCRQTDFIQAVAATGLPVNIKKGQFMAPEDMGNVLMKAKAVSNDKIMLCERGASFGYHNLVVDMRGLDIMKRLECPVIFDATHSVQLPGGAGDKSSGQREFVPVLARAAVAVGVAGVFMETHPNPEKALSDGPNAWPLKLMRSLLLQLQAIDRVVKKEMVLC